MEKDKVIRIILASFSVPTLSDKAPDTRWLEFESTCPGTDRFDLSFSKGQIVIENDSLVKIITLSMDEEEFAKTTKASFSEVPSSVEALSFEKLPNKVLQARLINNFVQSVLGREEIICPLSEGIKSVRMINATYMSAWNERPVSIDFDPEEYEKALNDKITQK